MLAQAWGFADRGFGVPNSVATRFGVASATKGLTALALVSLIEDGGLKLATTARSVLGDDLPLVDEHATVEHLLAHRSGVGDYLDEDQEVDLTDYLMPVPVHELATTEQYLRVLDGHPAKFTPGARFSYCNSGYVILALIAERVSGTPFHELVQERVCRPAGMTDTVFLRSDELDGTAARGYLFEDGLRTNVLHLPVRGSGDGGVYTTVADIHLLWAALFAGRIIAERWVDELVRPRSEPFAQGLRYGMGFWLHASRPRVILEGCDAGVSFRSFHDREHGVTATVVANTSSGAWPLARHLDRFAVGLAAAGSVDRRVGGVGVEGG